jgi:hypothetical protein
MKLQFRREYKTASISNLRVQIGSQCSAMNISFRLEPGSTATEHRIAIERIIFPGFIRFLKGEDYLPGPEPCVDCLDCEETDCAHQGKKINQTKREEG